MKNKKAYDKIRYRQQRFPDKPCLRCGHNNKKSLKVISKINLDAKVVLCLNCREELKD